MAGNLDGGASSLALAETQLLEDSSADSNIRAPAIERGLTPPATDDNARCGTTSSAFTEQPTSYQDFPIQGSSTLEAIRGGKQKALWLPSVRADRETTQYLRGELGRIAVGVEGLIRNAIQRSRTAVDSVDASVRRYQNRSRLEVKFTVRTKLNPEQAFALWDEIGKNLDDWKVRLSPRAQRLLDEQVGISVEWVDRDAG